MLSRIQDVFGSPRVQRVCTLAAAAYVSYMVLAAATRAALSRRGRRVDQATFKELAWAPIRAQDAKYRGEVDEAVMKSSVFKGAEDPASYANSGAALARFCASGMVKVADVLRPTSEKLFWFHKTFPAQLEGGHSIRFTVQSNLFAGSVANLGSDAQREQLERILAAGELGCFALTEVGAGVLSGLVVETTATWGPEGFELHTPSASARKFWISQGLVARWAVVVARLLLPRAGNERFDRSAGRAAAPGAQIDLGPHVFLVDIAEAERRGQLVREDMELKVDFNSLDNAVLTFTRCVVPHAALLSRVSSVDAASGRYALADPATPFRFEMMAQRLLSGRICIAWATLALVDKVVRDVRAYDRPIMTGPTQRTQLCEMPTMRALLDGVAGTGDVFRVFAEAIEVAFRTCSDAALRHQIDRIACAKILALEYALAAVFRLKTRVGSYSLQARSPFGVQNDILLVYAFAEGDVGILKQKMARDIVTATSSSPLRLAKTAWVAAFGSGLRRTHAAAVLSLVARLAFCGKEAMRERWFRLHEVVDVVARTHCILEVYDTVVAASGVASAPQLDAYQKWFGAI